MKRYLIYALSALLLSGCFKEVATDTLYVLKPLVQTTSGGVSEPLIDAVAYAFDADTTDWFVASYEDAARGVITSKSDHKQTLSTILAEGLPCDTEGMTDRLQMSLPPRSVMLVAVDTQNRIFAYNQVEMQENIGQLYVTLIFKPWKEASIWKEGWTFCNPDYAPTITKESFVKVAAQAVEGAGNETIQNVKVMAFAADTTEWRIASYDDAVGGMLTLKQDAAVTRSNPEFNGYETNEKGTFRMNVSGSPLMVVVVDRTHRMYAYSQQIIDYESSESPTFSILFRLWQNCWISKEDGWRVVNPEYEPVTEEEQTPSTENQE